MIVGSGKDVDGVQKIEPVGAARQIQGQLVGLGIVAVGVVAFRERSGDECAAVHLSIVGQIEAHLDGVAAMDGIADGIALGLRARLEGNAPFAAKGDGSVAYKHLVERDGLGAGQVGEAEAQHAAAKTHANGIAQREILGVNGLATVGDGGGIAPAGHPFLIVFCHGRCCCLELSPANLALFCQKDEKRGARN